ncbi:5-formyltetrahydrofolate cyclo-ligase [Sphingopyxis sp. P8]|uniref:5-formyltetrahydrofolate cyclo-ligase n=1 Tax=Sphingopyxis sp. P8 TaxID=2763256 RepID=UPI001D09F1F8|nr:5-formyltetrahydrofolate cyclo-ligase [Sphingopyxis sp. P8]
MPDAPSDMAEQKQRLREKLRFRRRHFAANLDMITRMSAFRTLPAPIAALLDPNSLVGAYVAMGAEPDIVPMTADLAALALPHHASRLDEMTFRRWTAGDSLFDGPWGVQQPSDDSASAVPDLIFCPLVGFDRHGGRIGQGGGHYDRWFAAHPHALRIGIGWSVQEVDAMPLEATDMPLDAVLTEQEFIVTGERL